MMRAILAGAIGCAVSLPAMAGDRPSTTLKPPPTLQTAARGAESLTKHAKPQSFMLPVGSAHLQPLPLLRGEGGRRALESPAAADLDGRPWEPRLVPERTAYANGSYAVRDVMNKRTYQPGRRRTALTAALVFRLDGVDDTDSVSVGGEGVAAAVWRAVPK